MSRLRADIVLNKNATGPFEASEGIKIPQNKTFTIGDDSGFEGKYLKRTSSGMIWGDIPNATQAQKGVVQIGTGLNISNGILNTNFDSRVSGLLDVNLTTPPIVGQILKWDGEFWTPQADANFSGDYNDLVNLPALTLEEITGRGNATFNPIIIGGLTVFDPTDSDRNSIYEWEGDSYNLYLQTATDLGRYNISIDDNVILRLYNVTLDDGPGVGVNTVPAFTGLDVEGNFGLNNSIHINSDILYEQSLIPDQTNEIDLGSSDNLWRTGYFQTNVLIGSGTLTGTEDQKLQVTGGTYISGDLGVGVEDPEEKVHIDGNIKLTGEIFGPSILVLDPAGLGDNTGLVKIKGDLQVDGVTTTINSTITTIADPIVELRTGNSIVGDDGGIQINLTTNSTGDVTAFQRVQWNNTNNRWETTNGTLPKPIVNTVDDFTIGGAFIFANNLTFGDSVNDTITVNSRFVSGTQLKTSQAVGNTLSLSAYDVDGTAYNNLITLTASNTPTLTIVSTGVGTIDNINIGATTRATGAFTTLQANSTTTINPVNSNVSITPSGTGILTISSGAVGTIDNVNIGATTRGTGAFTTLNANGNTVLGDASVDTLTVNATSTFVADVFLNANLTIGNADTDTIFVSSHFAGSTQLKTSKNLNETLNISAFDVDGNSYTNLITLTASNNPLLTIASVSTGTINNMSIGASTRSTGAFTTLEANSTTTINPVNNNVAIAPSGSGVLTISSGAVGTINNVNIGNTTRGTAAFTTLDANGNVILGDASSDTLTVNSTSTFNSSVTISGVSSNLTVGGELRGPEIFVIDPAAIGDNTGIVRIKGGLEVLGTTTTINSIITTIADPIIELRTGNSIVGDTGGVQINLTTNGSGVVTSFQRIQWNNGDQRWETTNGITPKPIVNTVDSFTFDNSISFDANVTLGNAVSDTITVNSQFVNGTQLRTSQVSGNTLSVSAYNLTTSTYNNLITLTASNTPTLTLVSTGVGNIDNMNIGATTRGTGAFTTLSATSTVGLSPANASVTISPTGTGVLTLSSGTVGTINNVNIGNVTRGTAAFTTLDANGNVILGDASTDTVTINGTTTVNAPVTFTGATSHLTLTGELRGPTTLIIDPATIGDNTGLVQIKGDLEVLGTTTTINSTVTTIADPIIELRRGNNLTASDGGVQINLTTNGSGGVTGFQRIQWNNINTRWETTNGITAKPLVNTVDSFAFANTINFNDNVIIGDSDSDSITINSQFVNGAKLRTAKVSGNTYSLSAFSVSGGSYIDLVTLTASNTPTIAITSSGVGTINNINIGATTRGTGAFTTLDANSTVTLSPASANVTLSPTGTGTVTISPAGGLTINPTTAGNINNTNIGATTRGTGSFTTLNANGNTTLGTNSSSTLTINATSTFNAPVTLLGGTTHLTLSGELRGPATFTIDPATVGDDTGTVVIRGGLQVNNTVTLSPLNATVTISPTGTGSFTVNPATTGNINNMNIGATTRGTGAFTTLGANSTVSITGATTVNPANLNVSITPTGTGVLTLTSGAVGNINNMNIGATTRGTGAFTTLNANGNTTLGTNTSNTLTVNSTTTINAPVTFTGVNSHVTLTGQLRGPATFIIDPAVVGDDTGTVEIKGSLQVNGANTADRLKNTAAPATATDTGTAGEIRYDADYIYICTATDTWKRVAIATWP
jgi:hypothetical protein